MEIRSNLNNNRMSFGSNAGIQLLVETAPLTANLGEISKIKPLNFEKIKFNTDGVIEALDKFEKTLPDGKIDIMDYEILKRTKINILSAFQDITAVLKESIKDAKNKSELDTLGHQFLELTSKSITPVVEKIFAFL
jgi:hypothetical protein